MVKSFRKIPVVIEALQYTGNYDEVMAFIGANKCDIIEEQIVIHTLEGDMRADYNDWIIKGIQGEFYPCKPDIFKETYEEVTYEDSDECQVPYGMLGKIGAILE